MTRVGEPTGATRVSGRRTRRIGNRIRRAALHYYGKLHEWAESGWSRSAVGLWALLQGSVVPGPSDTFLIPLGLGEPSRAYTFAAWATMGATIGGLIAYYIGAELFEVVGGPLLSLLSVGPGGLEQSRDLFDRHGWKLVALSTISPLSTKFVCIAAGALGVPVLEFTLALVAGRAARFFLIATLIRYSGEKLRLWLERQVGRAVHDIA
jgi:membrane protein YqaA with SNARE-associated domain